MLNFELLGRQKPIIDKYLDMFKNVINGFYTMENCKDIDIRLYFIDELDPVYGWGNALNLDKLVMLDISI